MKHMAKVGCCLATVAGLAFGAMAEGAVGLPEGYRRVAFLASDGAERVNTGIDSRLAFGFELGLRVYVAGGGGMPYAGGGNFYLTENHQSYYNQIKCTVCNGAIASAKSVNGGNAFNDLAVKDGVFTINGTQQGTYTAGNALSSSAGNIFLFAYNASTAGKSIISYARIYDANGGLLRNFVPVLDADGRPGFYDVISNVCCYSATTTDLVAGPVVPNADFTVDAIPDQTFDGSTPCRPVPTVRDADGNALAIGGFTCVYDHDAAVGSGAVTVIGKSGGAYQGQHLTATYRITGEIPASVPGETLPVGTYVQNGLVTQWDGFNNAGVGLHDAYANVWKDLKGTLDLTLNANGFWSEKALEVRGYSGVAAAAASAYQTIEVVCRLYSGMQSIVFTPGISDSGGVHGYARVILFMDNGKVCRVSNPWSTGVKQISYAKFDPEADLQLAAVFGQNGQPIDTYTNGVNTGSGLVGQSMPGLGCGRAAVGGWPSGGNPGTDPTFGRIYTIRLYNTLLSDGEVAYNAAVDAVRFGGKSPAEAFTGDMRWNAGTSSVEVRVTPSLVAGEGAFTVNGSGAAEAWATFGKPVTVTYVPAEGEVPLSWSDLPSGATVSDDLLSVTFVASGAAVPKLQIKTVFGDEGSLIADGGFEDGSGYIHDGAHFYSWAYRWMRSGEACGVGYSTPNYGFTYVHSKKSGYPYQTGVVIPAGDYMLSLDYAYFDGAKDLYVNVKDSKNVTRTLFSVTTDSLQGGRAWHTVEVPVSFAEDGIYTFSIESSAGNAYVDFDNVRLVCKTDLRIDPIPNQPYLGEVVQPPVTVRDADGNVLVEGTDYELRWGANNSVGNGYVAAVGKDGHYGVAGANFIIGKPIYVTPEGISTADGASWATAVDFATALSKAAAASTPCEIWVAGSNVMAAAATVRRFTTNVQLRGGFAGTEDSLADREDGALSVLDGAGLYDVMSWKGFPNVQFERLQFMNCPKNVLLRDGGNYRGGATLEDCVFENDATTSGSAVCLNCASSKEKLILRNCRFRGTAATGASTYAGGAAINMKAGAVEATGCEFTDYLGNGKAGSVVNLEGADSGTVFDHCLFRNNTAIGPCVHVNRSAVGAAVGFNHCTFAFNAGYSTSLGAGINGVMGTITVRNSIFYGNSNGDPSVGADITCGGNAPCDLDYTLFAADDSAHIVFGNEGASKKGPGMLAGNPLFVSETDVHLLSEAGYFDAAGVIHYAEEGVRSPAIDAGDPESDCSRETPENGGCANLGYYGNTEQASRTPFAMPMVDGAPQVAWNDPDGYSMPTVSFTMGGTGSYTAQAVIYISTDGGDTWENVSGTIGGLVKGDISAFTVSGYYASGTTILVKVGVSGAGYESESETASVEVQGVMPPWAGKKGPANVIHVRPGATGKGDGTSWTDAFTSFGSAVEAVTELKDEIWVAGTNRTTKASEKSILRKVSIRGGFRGWEESAAERPEGLRSVIDGGDEFDGFIFSNTKPMQIERMEFRHGATRGLKKTGGDGDLTVIDCVFAENGAKGDWGFSETGQNSADLSPTIGGGGAAFYGTSAATLTVRNCRFEKNTTDSSRGNKYIGSGGGAFVKFFGLATIADCVFSGNNAASNHKTSSVASGLGAYETRLTVTNCVFECHGNGEYVIGTGKMNVSGPSRFVNCRITGNTGSGVIRCIASDSRQSKTPVSNEFENCTFAYNLGTVVGTTLPTVNMPINNKFHNCILWSNKTDIALGNARCSVEVDWTLLRSTNVSVSAGSVSFGAGIITNDPQFVTTPEAAAAKAAAKEPGINVHLRGGSGYRDEQTGKVVRFRRRPVSPNCSPIDGGDPAVKCVEPKPNGHRVNLGAYGNTPWATMSPAGTALILR